MNRWWWDFHYSNKIAKEKFLSQLLALESSTLPKDEQFIIGISASQEYAHSSQ